jgi:Kef-type K+ transport system membrane component KefB
LQRFLTVAVCLCAVGAVAYLHWPSPEAIAQMSPWGVGVVFGSLFLAVISGEIARFLQLPRVFGYVVLGLIAIPLQAGLFQPSPALLARPEEAFADFQSVFTIALAVTGLAIGIRLDLGRLRAHLRAALLHGFSHILAVGGAVFGLLWWFVVSERLPLASTSAATLAFIALLATTSSPTALYAVNSDLRAEGRLPNLQLDVAVVKNALVVIAVAAVFFIGVRQVEIDRDLLYRTFALRWDAVAIAAGASIGAGIILLGALRWVTNQVVFIALSLAAIAGIALPEAEILVFVGALAAGAIVGNGSRFAFQLSESLDRSNPFFLSVVFVFLLIDVDVSLRLSVWMFAVGAMATRSIVMYTASRLVGRWDATGGRHLTYSLFAQSLVALFAVRAAQQYGGGEVALVEQTLAPLVILDLLFGSLMHRVALLRSGFATEVDAEPEDEVVVRRSPTRRPSLEAGELDDPRSMLPEPTFDAPEYRSEKLNRCVLRVRQRLFRAQDRLAHDFFGPRGDYVEYVLDEVRDQLQEHVYDTFEDLREVADPLKRKELMRRRRADLENLLHELYLGFGPSHEPGDLADTIADFLVEVERACDTDKQIRAPEEALTREEVPSDDVVARLRKAFHAMNTRFGPRPMRVVPARALALHHLAHGLPETLAPAVHLNGRFRVFLWQRVRHLFRDADEMFVRTLEHLDEDVAEAGMEQSPLAAHDEQAAARESEELAAFDRRLLEVVVPTDLEPEAEAPVEPMLGEEESSVVADPVLAAWSQFIEELPEDFEDLERDVLDFGADVRRRFSLVIDSAYENLKYDLARAGTHALPARRIDPASRQSAAERALEELNAEIAHWRKIAMAFVDKHSMHLEFRELEYRLRKQLDSFVNQVETELCSHLTYYPAEISERCEDVVETLSDTLDAGVTDADLTDAFVQIRRNLSDFLQDEALHSVQEMRDTNLVATLMRKFTDRLDEMARSRREAYIVVDDSFLDRPEAVSVRDVSPSEIPFQDILGKFLVQATVASFNELSMRIGNVVDSVATGLGEVNRVISFNLDAAASELRTEEETNRDLVAEFALGGIQRAGANAATLLEQVQDEIDGIDHDILELTVDHVRTVRSYLFDESMGRLQKLAVEVEKDRSQLQRRGFRLLGELRETASDTFDRVARPAMIAADLARERLHLEEHGRNEFVEDVGVATFEWEQLSRLPLAYRRLFTPTPVEIPELFVPRTEELETVGEAIDQWKSGRRVSVVVTGDLASGKTSFVHRVLADELGSVKMLRWNVRDRITSERRLAIELCNLFGLRRTESLERVRGALHDIDARRVIVVDGIERLFLRTMEGNDAFEQFLSLVAQSPAELLWLASCNTRLWEYLDTMLDAADFFTHQVTMDRFDEEGITELIMRRHRVSGYDLEFLTDRAEQLTPSRFVKGREQRLRRRYFRRLARATGGHPLLALYYWLASLDVSEEETLLVRPLRTLRTDYLHQLPDDKLIGLGQIVLHEELTEQGFASVMRTDADAARRDLALFESLNLVVREPGRAYQYRVNQVLYHDVARALTERNIA